VIELVLVLVLVMVMVMVMVMVRHAMVTLCASLAQLSIAQAAGGC
jgi:hypothetical protein